MPTLEIPFTPAHEATPLTADLAEVGKAVATAVAINYLIDRVAGRPAEAPTESAEAAEPASARNSWVRQKLSPVVGEIVGFIDEKAPDVTARHLTLASAAGVIATGALLYAKPDRRGLWVAYTGFHLLDMLDGALIRHKEQKTGLQRTPAEKQTGMLEDTVSDRIKELTILATLSRIAARRGNTVGAALLGAGAAVCVLPSLTRSVTEANGDAVAEGASGAWVPRAIWAGVDIGFNKPGRERIANTAAAAIVTSSATTTFKRAHVARHGSDSPYHYDTNDDLAFRKEARIRRRPLTALAVGGAVVGVALIAKALTEPPTKARPTPSR